MILDSVLINSLMTWARTYAPYAPELLYRPYAPHQRRIRLEITAEPLNDTCHTMIMCRVYLAEPKCLGRIDARPHVCNECRSLADTRIG